jgi:hypothetical protein
MERAVKVDFFSFTTRRSISDVCALFSYLPNRLEMKEHGLYGYGFSMVSPDGVTLLFSLGRSDVHVQISGRGCDRELCQLVDLLTVGDVVTRLDIAIDCIGSGFTCAEIWGYLQRGCFLSVSSDIRQCEGLLSRGGRIERAARDQGKWSGSSSLRELPNSRLQKTRSNSGHTIYVGSASSDRMVRIYDKGAEQGTGTDWLRFEVQLRRQSANQFFLLACKEGDSAVFEEKALGLLNKQIRLIEPGQDKLVEQRNYSFLKLLPFWEKLVSKIGPLKLQLPKPLKTVRNTIRYIKGAGAAIKMLKGVMEDFPEFIHSVVEDAVLKPHHVAMQDDFMQMGQSQSDSYYHYLLCSQP